MHLDVLIVVLSVSKYVETNKLDFNESKLKGNNCERDT